MDDALPLVGLTAGGEDRVDHQLVRDGADVLAGDVAGVMAASSSGSGSGAATGTGAAVIKKCVVKKRMARTAAMVLFGRPGRRQAAQ